LKNGKSVLTTRLARARKRAGNSRTYRLLGARGTAALLMGAALSVGGLTQALEGAHFVVEKDLDSVQVVKQQGKRATVVADVHDSFAANSIFKLSRVLPESLVSQRIALFDDAWLPKTATDDVAFSESHARRDVFHEEMSRINDAIRGQFFANAMPYGDLIHDKAIKYDVDPALVAAVIEQESKFHRTAHSPVGARGLMQLMPRTGRWLGARNLYDPEQNVDAGVKYIKYLQHRFDGNVKKTIAAYNAGEGNVKRYNGIPPFRETQTYVKRVMRNYAKRNEELRDFSADHAAVADAGVRTLR
jgi:soluble lytic murein transglycosylase-like protein